jgi:sortase A
MSAASSLTSLGAVAGLIALVIGLYQLYGTGLIASHAQARLRKTPIVAHPKLGAPVARLRVPAIHLDVIVVEGVGMKQLAEGPGHYPMSAPIGKPGVTAVAGHSSGWGAPFMKFDRLLEGMVVIFDVKNHEYRYLIVKRGLVQAKDVWVLKGDPWSNARSKLVLTTCWPIMTSRERLILWGDLISAT